MDRQERHRQEEERTRRLHKLAQELASAFPSEEEWQQLPERAKKLVLTQTHELIHLRMGIQHETGLSFIERGYDEGTGAIQVPVCDLESSPLELAGFLCHELQHARQFDVMLGRARAPGDETERKQFEDAYATYDPTNRFNYTNSVLEHDANDRRAELMSGFSEAIGPKTDGEG